MKLRLAVALLLLAALASCAHAPPHAPQMLANRVGLQEVLDAALLVTPESDPARLIASLGVPQHTEVERVANRYNPRQLDTLKRLDYPGLSLTVYEVANIDKALIVSLLVKDPAFESGLGLRVGDHRAEVASKLGAAEHETASAASYLLFDAGPPHQLIVHYRGDEVRALEWQFYWE
jgi:hypothetical protein